MNHKQTIRITEHDINLIVAKTINEMKLSEHSRRDFNKLIDECICKSINETAIEEGWLKKGALGLAAATAISALGPKACDYKSNYDSDDFDANVEYVDDVNWDEPETDYEINKKHGPFTYKTSERSHKFIKSYEKLRLHRYKASNKEKYYTIGWGHYLQKPSERNIVTITKEQAEIFFLEDIEWVDAAVTRLLNEVNPDYEWPQGMVDGLGSLVYNCGENGIRNSKFFQTLKKCRFKNGKIDKSDIAFALSLVKRTKCFEKGHVPRRAGEYKLMNADKFN